MKIIIFIACLQLVCSISNASKTCLTEYTNINNLKFQRSPETGQFVNVWIVSDDTPAYDCFKNERKIKRLLKMRKRYRVLQDNFNIRHKGNWSLLVQTDKENEIGKNICGWVSHDHIIVRNQPIKNYKTGIFQKILIKQGDSNNGKTLKIFNDPNLQINKEVIEVGTIFYVYDFYPPNARTPESYNTKSLLIGVHSLLDTTATNSPFLIGWVYRKNVTFWNSRAAFEFPVGKRGKIYNNGNVIFETEKIKTPLSYNELRNPILKDMGNEYLVGTFSRLTKGNFEIREKIKQIKTGLEVLFVIDGTRSMTKVFNEIIDAIENVVRIIAIEVPNNIGGYAPRFALMFYRDKATRSSVKKDGINDIEVDIDYCNKEITYFPMDSNVESFVKNLQNHIACDSDDTLQESMYSGLIEGIKLCRFDTGENGYPKRMRTIIHFGDAGDNGRGDYTAKDVLSIFKQYHIFKYISVNVSDNNSSEFNKSIINISFDKSKTNHIHINQQAGLRKKIMDLLLNDYHVIKRQTNLILKGFTNNEMKYNKNARGFAGISQGRIGVVSNENFQYAKALIKANNFQIEGNNPFQLYIEGKISKDEPIKKYLLVSRTHIEQITNALSIMYEYGRSKEKRKKVLGDFLKNILWEETCEFNGTQLSLEKCNKLKNGIPIKADFMKYTKKQFIHLNGDKLNNVLCEAKIARDSFKAFVDNKYISKVRIDSINPCRVTYTYEQDINGDGKIVTDIDNKMVDKYFFKEGGEEMAWIPLEHFSFILEGKQ